MVISESNFIILESRVGASVVSKVARLQLTTVKTLLAFVAFIDHFLNPDLGLRLTLSPATALRHRRSLRFR